MFQLLKQYRKGFPAIDIFTPAIQEIQLTVCHHQLICHQPEKSKMKQQRKMWTGPTLQIYMNQQQK